MWKKYRYGCEHLNRLCKTAIEGLGANKSKRARLRIGRTVGMLEALLNNFDNDNDVTNISQAHTARNIKKDLNIVVKELQEIQASTELPTKYIVHLKT